MPFYPRGKGKVEKTVAYVKHNCFAGHKFTSIEELNAHVEDRLDNVADKKEITDAQGRAISTMERFDEERSYLRSLNGRPGFLNVQILKRKVGAKGRLHINNRRYELPLEHTRTEVQVRICGDTLEVFAGFQRIKTFNTHLGASKVITIESSLDSCAPGFGNTVNNSFAPLRGFNPIPKTPLCRDFSIYVNAMGE